MNITVSIADFKAGLNLPDGRKLLRISINISEGNTTVSIYFRVAPMDETRRNGINIRRFTCHNNGEGGFFGR